jgi:hypothetical protein
MYSYFLLILFLFLTKPFGFKPPFLCNLQWIITANIRKDFLKKRSLLPQQKQTNFRLHNWDRIQVIFVH